MKVVTMLSTKKSFFALLFCLCLSGIYAQSPSLINYQGIARDADGRPYGNQPIALKFELRQGSATSGTVFAEIQAGVLTNSLGLFSTQIGKVGNLTQVNWEAGTLFLEVSIDPDNGNDFISMGKQQLVSVPYAQHAASVPASYTNNVLTVGNKSYTLSSTPVTTINASGAAIVTSSNTNSFDINVPETIITGSNAATVSGSFPNFTVDVAVPPTPTITGSGIANISSPVTNSFNVFVPQTNVYAGNDIGVFGAFPNYTINSTVPHTSLTGMGTATVSGTFPNYSVNVAAQPQTTVTGTGAANVTSPGTNSFQVNVPQTTLTGSGTALVSGAFPNYTVDVPAPQTPSFTGAGTATVTGSFPSYTIDVPTVAIPTIAATGITATAGIANVQSTGTNSFDINVPQTNVYSGNNVNVTGTFPNYTVNSTVAQSTVTGINAANVTSAGTNSFQVDVPQTNISSGDNINVAGTFPNYTVNSTVAQSTVTGVNAATVTSAGTNSFQVDVPQTNISSGNNINVSGTFPNYTVNSTVAQSTVTALSGIATVTTAGTNSFDINVPQTNISSGNNINVAGTFPNYTVNSTVAQGTVTALSGIATVTTAGTNSFDINVPQTNISSGDNINVTGTFPNYTVNSTVAQSTVTGVNAATVTSSGTNSFQVNVPQTNISAGNDISVSGTFPNYTIHSSVAQTSVTGINAATVTPAGTNSFQVNVPQTNITGTGVATVLGTFPNYTVDVAAQQQTSLTGLGTATVSGTFPNYTVDVAAPPTPTVTGTGIATVTSSGNSFTVDVPAETQTLSLTGNSLSISGGNTVTLSEGWGLTGNAGTTPSLNFIGTTDTQTLNFRVNNLFAGQIDGTLNNMFLGVGSGSSITTGTMNTGYGALALSANTTGSANTANGAGALLGNTSGNNNTATGYGTMVNNSTGNYNTATGSEALNKNTIGIYNTANGFNALIENTTGGGNTASGALALTANTTGTYNTASGVAALSQNTTGNYNTAIGGEALNSNTTGDRNTALGYYANVAAGTLTNATVIGANAVVTASDRVKLGDNADVEFDRALMPNNNAGAVGEILMSQGTGAAPIWTTAAGGNAWNLTGNAGTNPLTNFIGTTDTQTLNFRVNNQPAGSINLSNTFLGLNTGTANTTGWSNTAFGVSALAANSIGSNNTAHGFNALKNNTGDANTAMGSNALLTNSTGNQNTAIGNAVMYYNTTGSNNTAMGAGALFTNTTGYNNTAFGANALTFNTTGSSNIGIGYNALYNNTTGSSNTGIGEGALYSNTIGNSIIGIGYNALYNNTSGNGNIGIGNYALYNTTTGYSNIGIGENVLYNNTTGNGNTGVGISVLSANTTGYSNTGIGANTLRDNTTGTGNTGIGTGALIDNTTGFSNTGVGSGVLSSNTTGNGNTGIGNSALYNNTTGNDNTGMGSNALVQNTAGFANAAFGSSALASSTGDYNTASGAYALSQNSSGSFNTSMGYSSLSNNTTGDRNTVLGANANVITGTLTGASAVGYNAWVGRSNAMSLGDTTNIQVGIGTASPNNRLSVIGLGGTSNSVLYANAKGSGAAIEAESGSASSVALLLNNGHLVTVGTMPTVGAGVGTIASGSTDMAGSVSAVTTNTISIDFAKAYASPPIVMLIPTNANAAAYGVLGGTNLYVTNTTTTGFTVGGANFNILTPGAFNYIIIGKQ